MYELPPLPYAYDSLEPYIDAKTMEIHYTKHHATYVAKLNEALARHPELFEIDLKTLLTGLNTLPEDVKTAVQNHGGGHYNHSFFWKSMTPGGKALGAGDCLNAIERDFGNIEKCKEQFTSSAVGIFGSGWAWRVLDEDKKLKIVITSNQNNPIMTSKAKPILGLDVWEHAYYLKYQNRRPEYINAWWNVVDWKAVESNFNSI